MGYLDRILESTRKRLDEAKAMVSVDALEQRLAAVEPARDFAAALRRDDIAIIGEIKRASPSAGTFDANLGASECAGDYARGGAAAISVLTEPEFFRGRLEDLVAARGAGLPVLRKDFVVDDYQVMEARAAGADAVLIIVRIVEQAALTRLLRATRTLGMNALVEVHTDEDLDRALGVGAEIIGVNHRDLDGFEVDPDRTAKLAPSVPGEVLLVGLSGVSQRRDVEALGAAGAAAVLVGEALVTAPDRAAAVAALTGVAR